MKKTILFDLDGTLTDSYPGISNAIRYTLNLNGLSIPEEKLMLFVGPPLTESFAIHTPSLDPELGVKQYREYYNSKGWKENIPYKGVEAMLQNLKDRGYSLNVATSKPEEMSIRILEHFNLAKYFDHIFGATLDESRSSKDRVIAYALDHLPNRGKTIMVGDRRHDIVGAHKNELPAVGVLYGYGDQKELQDAGAEFIVKDPDELEALLVQELEKD